MSFVQSTVNVPSVSVAHVRISVFFFVVTVNTFRIIPNRFMLPLQRTLLSATLGTIYNGQFHFSPHVWLFIPDHVILVVVILQKIRANDTKVTDKI